MSQSAENQSAIIENENNFNIAVESLAAESEPSHADLNLDSLCNAEAEPRTPVQDEMEEGMDVGEGHENAQNISEFAVGDDAGEEFSSGAGDVELKSDIQNPAEEAGLSQLGGEPSGAQGVSELQVPFFPAEGEDHDVDTGTMDVDQPEPGEDQQVEGRGGGYSEPTSTDDVQDFDSGQHNVDEDVGSELADSQAEPLHYEADSDNHLAAAPDSSCGIEGDQSNSVDMEERGVQQSETLEEDQNLPMGDAGQPVESATPDEDQNLATTYGEEQEGKCKSSEYQNVEGEDTEGKQDETGICDVLSMEDTEEQLDESEGHGYQNQPMEETEGQQDASGIPDYQNQAMEETGQQSESGIFDSDQDLSVENIDGQQDESGLPDEDPSLAEQYSTTQEDENETACDQDKMVEETEQDKQVESEGPESDQLLQMQNTEQDQQIESARTEDDQDVAMDETEQGQNAVTVDDLHLPEEGGQDEQQADVGNGKDVDEQQLDSSVTEDTQGIKTDIEMADCEAEVKDEVSGNEEGSAAVASVSENTDLECGNIESEENTTTGGDASGDVEKTGLDQDTNETSISESKSSDGLDKLLEEGDQAMDAEGDRASDATIVEGRDIDDEPMLQVTDIKSGAEAEEGLDERQESMGDDNADDGNSNPSVASKTADTKAAGEVNNHIEEAGMADTPSSKTAAGKADGEKKSQADDDDDVVVLDDDEAASPQVKKGLKKEVLNSNNDMGIQIESVSGRANDVHGYNEQTSVKQDNADQKPVQNSTAPKMESKSSAPPVKKSSRTQTCIVCKKVGKCKYNIVRNGDIKHLCDNTCFKRFRANPTLFLKGAGAPSNAPAANKKGADVKAPPGAPGNQGLGKASVPGYKTCTVCMVMNINAQGQFCVWKGLDFCGEGCLGKFQSGISSSCALCTAFIPLAQRSTHCLRIGSQMRPFCSNRCYADYKLRLRLCTQCQKDAASAPDTFFSAPVGSDGIFKDFCSQACMKTFEELLNTDVEIIRVPPGKPRSINKCSVCQKKELIKHIIKYKGTVHNLCTDPCLSAFQYANKLDMNTCDFCSTLCTSRESSLHTVQFEGHQKRFCSETCVTKFRLNNRKVSPCSWCGTQRDNFDMIERLDSSSKYQLFCSLNCLSLYRVNLQAKSNQPVTCDQCSKRAPAQYHLTMSDASVRNFCSYNCVMTFQAQFSKGPTGPPATSAASAPPPTPPPPKHKHNTRGRAGRGRQQQSPATSPSFPIISNVISLAPQGGQQQVNIKNSTGMPVMVSGANQTVKTTSVTSQAPVQQQIIIQPPPPKPVKNKSLLCKPFVQTKATSCRPHTQSKECQTDEVKQKPALVPVPVPVYLPAPMALYSAPAPTPIFVPIPIPVPIFIPTTRKSANGILKQIKEIREKTPSDPLEAELLMMAAAVSADGKNSSDSESEEEMLPEINRPRKRMLQADDDDDADVMPLTTNKEEEGGEEDMISMALRMAEEMSGPITDLESAVEAVPVNTEPPPQPPRSITPDSIAHEEEMIRNRRGGKRGGTARRGGTGRPAKRPRIQVPQPEPVPMRQEPPPPPPPPADANYHLKFTYGVNAWRHWVLFKNNQIERTMKPGCGRVKLFKTDIMQCTADELNFSLCLFVKEVRKPNSDEYSPDSIYYLCLGIQQYLFENGRIDNIFTDFYYERFTECLTQILSNCQPKFNASGQMVCRIEEEHLWECKQLGAHSPYVLLNTLIYFHTKYFMLKTPEDHMKLSFAHILKYWKKGQPGKGGQPARSVSLRYYSVSTAKKDGSAPTSATKKGSKDGIPVYEVTENQENPLRCPVKLYEFYLSKCPESIKNRSDIFYPVPERSCVPDSPVWYSTTPISLEVMTKMLTRILLVREIQEAHLHAQPIYV